MRDELLNVRTMVAVVLATSACTMSDDVDTGDDADPTLEEVESALNLFNRRITNPDAPRCLNVGFDPGVVVSLSGCTELLRWNIDDVAPGSSTHVIRWAGIPTTGSFSRCLTHVGGSLQSYPCNGKSSQEWQIDLVLVAFPNQYKICWSGLCLTTKAGSTKVYVQPYDGSVRQRWVFVP